MIFLKAARNSRFTIELGAAIPHINWAFSSLLPIVAVFLTLLSMTGCSALPDKPVRSNMYDFGPDNMAAQPLLSLPRLAPLAIDDITTPGGALDNLAVLYRLAYDDAQQLRAYTLARWALPPAQLFRQRLRDTLSQRRVVFGAGESAALNRSQNAALPRLLRLELEEFSHVFGAVDSSVGLVRLRATLLEVTPAGEKLIDQRRVVVQRPATSSDAVGGVRALTEATDAAIQEIDQWVQQYSAR